MHLPACVDEMLAQREVCQAFEKAPRAPLAGTSAVAAFNEKLQVDLLLLVDIVALHVLYVFSKLSPLIPVRTKNAQDVRAAICNSWVGVCGPPFCIQMDGGGEWKNELWAELRS